MGGVNASPHEVNCPLAIKGRLPANRSGWSRGIVAIGLAYAIFALPLPQRCCLAPRVESDKVATADIRPRRIRTRYAARRD